MIPIVERNQIVAALLVAGAVLPLTLSRYRIGTNHPDPAEVTVQQVVTLKGPAPVQRNHMQQRTVCGFAAG